MLSKARDEIAPLFGRADEQRILASALDEIPTRGQALVLRGEPGIGKSRLLSEAAERPRERGMLVLNATGVQSRRICRFAGLHQLLRPVRGRAVELQRIQRDALDAAFGPTDEVTPEPYRIAMAALDLISDVATDRPVVLVVDDEHWLDRPTADVLAFVARRIESDPVLLLTATREGYPQGLADAGLPEHRIDGLDEATAASLLDAAAPGLPLATRSRVLDEAAGNPLALLELPAATGRSEGVQAAPGGLPLTQRLERAFGGPVSDLPDAARLLLLTTTCCGSRLRGRGGRAPARARVSWLWTQPTARDRPPRPIPDWSRPMRTPTPTPTRRKWSTAYATRPVTRRWAWKTPGS